MRSLVGHSTAATPICARTFVQSRPRGGVAPLWQLVPWKEAKNYWDELLKGEYEWSSIGKQLRQKGLVK